MFDNLRDEVSTSYEDDQPQASYQPAARTSSSQGSGRMFGLTSFQRFIVSFLILISVCIIGMACLLVTNKIGF